MTDVYSESESVDDTLKKQANVYGFVSFSLPWLILCRLGKEQLGRAFHRYSTSMQASTQSARVGVCFRNLSACKR